MSNLNRIVEGVNGRIDDPFCKGLYVYCRFGFEYLICKPQHKPQDLHFGKPLMEMWASTAYGIQFLENLHPWKNNASIIEHIFCYLHNDQYVLAHHSKGEIINNIALKLAQRELLIIPLVQSRN